MVNKGADDQVSVRGQFDDAYKWLQVSVLDYLGTATSKNSEAVLDRKARLIWYWGVQPPEPDREVALKNQFGSLVVLVGRGRGLLVPAWDSSRGRESGSERDHFKVYQILRSSETVATRRSDSRTSGEA